MHAIRVPRARVIPRLGGISRARAINNLKIKRWSGISGGREGRGSMNTERWMVIWRLGELVVRGLVGGVRKEAEWI